MILERIMTAKHRPFLAKMLTLAMCGGIIGSGKRQVNQTAPTLLLARILAMY